MLISLKKDQSKLEMDMHSYKSQVRTADVQIRRLMNKASTPEQFTAPFVQNLAEVWPAVKFRVERNQYHRISSMLYHRETMVAMSILWTWLNEDILALAIKILEDPGMSFTCISCGEAECLYYRESSS